MIVVRPANKDFYRFEGTPRTIGSFISKSIPADYRWYQDQAWFVHKKYVLQVITYSYLKHGELDYSGLPQELQKEIQEQKKQYGTTLSSIVSPKTDAHSTLYLTTDAPKFIIDAVWKAIIKNKHPDVGGDAAEFLKLKEAYESISHG